MDAELKKKDAVANLIVYGAAHAVSDGTCAFVLSGALASIPLPASGLVALVILYNALSFGLQPVLGIIFDWLKKPRLAAAGGLMITGISAGTALWLSPVLAVACIGVGNALFHIGGGSVSLNIFRKKAAAPGIFVAPGAAGLLAGTLLGTRGYAAAFPLLILSALLCILIFLIRKPEMDYKKNPFPVASFGAFNSILVLVLLSVAIRALVGTVISFPWKAVHFELLLALTGAIVLGKGIGGFLADKFGWMQTAVLSLAASIPFLIWGSDIPALGIIGIFLFNITMPVTLTLLSNTLPGRPGSAFGLTVLALLAGSAPALLGQGTVFGKNGFVISAVVISALALYAALRKFNTHFSDRKEGSILITNNTHNI